MRVLKPQLKLILQPQMGIIGANLPWMINNPSFQKRDSSLFNLDANGSLTAKQIFDFETIDRNYSITVFATHRMITNLPRHIR